MNDKGFIDVSVSRSIRFSQDVKNLLSKILVKDPAERITLEMIQKTVWYNKGFEAAAPMKYVPITVTEEQIADAMSKAKITEVDDAPAVGAGPAAPSGPPT